MTLASIYQPFAQFTTGTALERGGMRTGLYAALLYRTERGEVCLIWRTPSMPAPAFTYFPSLAGAWPSYARLERAAKA